MASTVSMCNALLAQNMLSSCVCLPSVTSQHFLETTKRTIMQKNATG